MTISQFRAGTAPPSAAYCLFETRLGSCGIAWREEPSSRLPPAVTLFQLPEATGAATEAKIARDSGATEARVPSPAIAAIIEKICRHFQGDPQDFREIAIALDGVGSFARQVYDAARTIPPGQTRTYGELARALDRPAASRAVGQALGRNPIPLIIPCHRVLAAGGKPGGFSAYGGAATKARMLALEGVAFGQPPVLRSEQDVWRAATRLRVQDPRLGSCMIEPIEFRPRREHSPYAALFTAVIYQQLTPKAASTILERVKSLYSSGEIPEPEELLYTPDQALQGAGLSRTKVASLKDLAANTLDGTVPSAQEIAALGDEEILTRLTSIHGIGRWTVEMLLIFNLGRTDILPVDDYALRKAVAVVYGMADLPTRKELSALGDAWRPYRTVASLYLWQRCNSPTTAG